MRHILVLSLAAAAVLSGCGDSGQAPSAPAAKATARIDIKDFTYSPTPATVRAGQKITVSNADNAPHTLTDRASSRAFDSGTIKGGASGSRDVHEARDVRATSASFTPT